ncbi:hypothetical protein [Enterococcus sp. AZ007]|uniref:hypothetical protein n=1 Tax=Enterococcus sp. AZ007 TaxID=2774839 RepID=UPI003F243571
MKKPLLQRKLVWVLIICLIGIGSCELKAKNRDKENEQKQEQLSRDADKVLKGKVKIPSTLFKTKEEVTELFKAADLTPNFVVSNFDKKATSNKHFLKADECDQINSDQPNVEYFDMDTVGDKYGTYADKGSTIIVGYSDHDFDGTEKKKTSTTKDTNSTKADKEKQTKESTPASSEKDTTEDITILSDEPTLEQQTTLDDLAQQKFNENFPYKGSKMHTILGIIQPWTQKDGKWYMKVEATVVNAANAKRETNVEIHITPTGPTSGNVELISY